MTRPFIVAELGASHLGSYDRAMSLVEQAAKAGADAVKLQTYTADTMVADRSYVIQSGPWKDKKLHDLYHEARTPLEWHEDIFAYCTALGLNWFSTPFDRTAVDFLENLNCPRYKVASFEITDLPLIRYIAKTRKPMIISTGMATMEEINKACWTAKNEGCTDITLLKCTSAYPAPVTAANLLTMQDMRATFGHKVGLSDHTQGIGTAIAATILGATVIEKHLKLDDDFEGPDSHFSLRTQEFKQMVEEITRASESLGEISYGPTQSELSSIVLRRSVYAIKTIRKGDTFTSENIALRRPQIGAPPSQYDLFIGKHAKMDITPGTPVDWDLIG